MRKFAVDGPDHMIQLLICSGMSSRHWLWERVFIPELKSTSAQNSCPLVLGHVRSGGTILLGDSLGSGEVRLCGLVEVNLVVETILQKITESQPNHD